MVTSNGQVSGVVTGMGIITTTYYTSTMFVILYSLVPRLHSQLFFACTCSKKKNWEVAWTCEHIISAGSVCSFAECCDLAAQRRSVAEVPFKSDNCSG